MKRYTQMMTNYLPWRIVRSDCYLSPRPLPPPPPPPPIWGCPLHEHFVIMFNNAVSDKRMARRTILYLRDVLCNTSDPPATADAAPTRNIPAEVWIPAS